MTFTSSKALVVCVHLMAKCQTNDTPPTPRHKTLRLAIPHMSFKITPEGKQEGKWGDNSEDGFVKRFEREI